LTLTAYQPGGILGGFGALVGGHGRKTGRGVLDARVLGIEVTEVGELERLGFGMLVEPLSQTQ
jgi:hypothetical protein